jgi:uncharacterized membrane protein
MRLILLTLHIGGGIFGILAGAVAMCFRKGSRWHALAGQVFVGAMLTMAACGATLAVMRQETPNILAGTLTFYLVATAWMTARRGDGKTGIFDWVALAFAGVVGVAEIAMGVRVVMNPAAGSAGVPVFMYFLFAAIVLLAAGGDARMVACGGIFGKKRIVRHLWRITFSFFIATGSFFLGQQKVFPAEWRGATIWLVLGLFPLVLLIGWMIRVWFTKYGRQLVVAEQR